jgi:hypothetical protein
LQCLAIDQRPPASTTLIGAGSQLVKKMIITASTSLISGTKGCSACKDPKNPHDEHESVFIIDRDIAKTFKLEI